MRTALAALREWIARLGGAWGRGPSDRDLEEELRLHLELAADEAARRGHAPETAARAARIAAGGVSQAMEAMRDQRGLPWIDDLRRDLGHAIHLLRRNPVFAGTAILSLALGVGANVAAFSFADALLLRPLAVPRATEVLTVGSTDASGGVLSASYREYVDIRDRARSFEGLVAFTTAVAALGRDADAAPTLGIGMLVSGNFFGVMGVVPTLGRDFRPDEDQVPGRDAVAILGHEYWERQFDADSSVLGRTIRLNGIAFTVIGVAPPDFTGLDQYTRYDFYTPLMMWPRVATDLAAEPLEARGFRRLTIKGRLRPGATLPQAQTEMTGVATDLERAYPDTNRNRRLSVRTELQNRIAQAPPLAALLAMLGTLAAAVLLVACANVAGLLTSQAPVRARELSLRMAIGAGRFRIVRQLVAESALIAALGGLAGLLVAYAGVASFRRVQFPTDLPISPSFDLDRRALLVSLAASVASALLFGLTPSIRAARADLISTMKASDAGRAGRRVRGRGFLVTGQVAVAVVLLVMATLFYRGFQQRLGGGPGFRTEHVLMMGFNPSLLGYSDARTHRFFEQLVDRVRLTPGVTSVALGSHVPMDGMPPRVAIVPEGFNPSDGNETVSVPGALIGEGYFETLGLSLLEGRTFRTSDTSDAPLVAVVNEQVAQHYWPSQDPLGKRFRLNDRGGPWVEIVGLAKTGKYGFITEPPREFLYLAYKQHPPRAMVAFVEAAGDPAALGTPLRTLVRELDANQPAYNMRTLAELYRLRVVVVLTVAA